MPFDPNLRLVRLSAEEEGWLGKMETDLDAFKARIPLGQSSMVCLFMELKDVNGGDGPGLAMDVEGHLLNSDLSKVGGPSAPRFKLHFKGNYVCAFRDVLYNYSGTINGEPIRALISGHGARLSARRDNLIVYDRETIICKLIPCPQDGVYSVKPESSLWYSRTPILEQATQDTPPAKPRMFNPGVSPRTVFPPKSPVHARVRSQSGQSALQGPPTIKSEPGLFGPTMEAGQSSASGALKPLPSTPTKAAPHSVVIKPEPSSQVPEWLTTPNKRPRAWGGPASPSARATLQSHASPSHARTGSGASSSSLGPRLSKPDEQPAPRGPTPPSNDGISSTKKRAHLEDDNGNDANRLVAEAEAEEFSSSKTPTAPSRIVKTGNTRQRTINPLSAVQVYKKYNVMAVVHAFAEPRPTQTGSGGWSQQVSLVDQTGFLKTMIFSQSQYTLLPAKELKVGLVLLVGGLNIQVWSGGSGGGKQGSCHDGEWTWSGLPPPASPEDPISDRVIGSLSDRPSEQEFEQMRQLSEWYHRGGGAQEVVQRFPAAKMRELRKLCDIPIGGECEAFDIIGEILECFPPDTSGMPKPADLFITDYTSHPETRAAFDQYLGYDESEYASRLEDGPGGGMVFRIALWDKQARAVHGLRKGQFVQIQRVKCRWNADYGISGSVGSKDDLNLKIRDASEHVHLPQLLERKKAWQEERSLVLAERDAEEEANEAAWREVHEDILVEQPAVADPSKVTMSSTTAQMQPSEPNDVPMASQGDGNRQQNGTATLAEAEDPEAQTKEADLPQEPLRQAGSGVEEDEDDWIDVEKEEVEEASLPERLSSGKVIIPNDGNEDPPVHLQLAAHASIIPLLQIQDLKDLEPSRPGRKRAIYARVRASLIDVAPRVPSQWSPNEGTDREGHKVPIQQLSSTFVLLLRQEDVTSLDTGHCLPVIVQGRDYWDFFDLENIENPELVEKEDYYIRPKRALEVLIGSKAAPEDGHSDKEPICIEVEDEEHRPVHEWGVAVWRGTKSGAKKYSIWATNCPLGLACP